MAKLIWLGWVVYFLVAEGYALLKHRDDETFSWQVWSLERKEPITKGLILAFLTWLALHFLEGG